MSILENMLKRLTSQYARRPDSNVGKLLNLAATEMTELQDALELTRVWRAIDQAEGTTLDEIGYNVQQFRGDDTDPVYRINIKARIAANMSDGTINRMIHAIALFLRIEPGEVVIDELWDDAVSPEPAAVWLNFPPQSLLEAGVTFAETAELINRIIAGGVRATALVEGTFQFNSAYYDPDYELDQDEFDNTAGFNGLDEFGDPLDVGGYFGWVYDPA